MCNFLNYSRDSYYKRSSRKKQESSSNEVVLRLVKEIRKDEPRTGTRKLHHRILPKLKSLDISVGRDKLFEILRENSMLVRRKCSYSKTTYSNHGYAVAPNRLKKLVITSAEEVFVSDITYIRVRGGFAYLFLVTDAYSRKIVGYHLSKDLSHYSAILALRMALESVVDSRGIVHHSDRGSQYCCHDFLQFLGEHAMVPSMTDENHCYQNAIAERVNGILKDEFDMDAIFESFSAAELSLERAVTVYNNKRTHWSLQLRTPSSVHSQAV